MSGHTRAYARVALLLRALCVVFAAPIPRWRQVVACAGPREHWIPPAMESELGRFWPVARVHNREPERSAVVYASTAFGDAEAEPPPL